LPLNQDSNYQEDIIFQEGWSGDRINWDHTHRVRYQAALRPDGGLKLPEM
jgi:hypothetical protein